MSLLKSTTGKSEFPALGLPREGENTGKAKEKQGFIPVGYPEWGFIPNVDLSQWDTLNMDSS